MVSACLWSTFAAVQGDGLGGSFDKGSMGRPSLSNGQKLFLNKQSGSYFRFNSARRAQFFPKQAIVRVGGSCLPINSESTQHQNKGHSEYGRTDGNGPPNATLPIVPSIHWPHMSAHRTWGPTSANGDTHLLRGLDASRIVDAHLPLV